MEQNKRQGKIPTCFPSIDRKKRRSTGEYWWWLVVQIPPAAPFISMHPDNIRIE
jgi:hypothetical protein